ncbi:hypothetical protein Y032_0627g810 [Ancylostoma ceylanicum]|uniref:Uncharacterized protein n=1 Tax=Ancylostoma ceylanicum TaxID=53326 RepID=A0A016WKL9_9BILA|nr:hypothetical protein Y032_0627g810 [Ancylostoma ceylanicum]
MGGGGTTYSQVVSRVPCPRQRLCWYWGRQREAGSIVGQVPTALPAPMPAEPLPRTGHSRNGTIVCLGKSPGFRLLGEGELNLEYRFQPLLIR